MRHPLQSLDDFFEAMEAWPETVWDAGPPLWESEADRDAAKLHAYRD
jgi:hypothetical protein